METGIKVLMSLIVIKTIMLSISTQAEAGIMVTIAAKVLKNTESLSTLVTAGLQVSMETSTGVLMNLLVSMSMITNGATRVQAGFMVTIEARALTTKEALVTTALVGVQVTMETTTGMQMSSLLSLLSVTACLVTIALATVLVGMETKTMVTMLLTVHGGLITSGGYVLHCT